MAIVSLETLPCCQRGAETEPGRYACTHPDFYGHGATVEMCAVCTGRGQKCGEKRQPRPSANSSILVRCETCTGNWQIKVQPQMSAEAALKVLDTPKEGWPTGWWDWPGVQDAYAIRADLLLERLPPYPDGRFQGRGVVIAAGGKYLPGAWVTIRSLRHFGCDLPIQVWYLGDANEMTETWRRILWPWGVECVNANEVRKTHPLRILAGYEIKPFAIINSPFREVLSLDADCYAARCPDFLFDDPAYKDTGAIFWPDLTHTRGWMNWGALRTQGDGHPPHETGQIVLDKSKWWDVCTLTLWANGHSDFFYRHQLGDKEIWHLYASRLHKNYAMYRYVPRWVWPAFLHDGPDMETLFVHKCQAKFVLEPGTQFYTAQQFPTPLRNSAMPIDDLCFAWMDELKTLLGRP